MREEITLKVYQAILGLLNEDKKISTRRVIDKMGRGSFSTVCPILSDIKEKTDGFLKLKPIVEYIKAHDVIREKAIDEASDSLLEKLSKHIDVLEKEKLNLQKELLAFDTTVLERDKYKKLYEELLKERDTFANSALQVKSNEMERLFDEIKAINVEHQRQQLELGSRLDQKLIEKEVQIVNLKAKLDRVNENPIIEIKDTEKEKRLKQTNQKLLSENERLVDEIEKLRRGG